MTTTTTLHDKFFENPLMTFDHKTLYWIIGLSATLIMTMTIADFAAAKFLDIGLGVVTPAGALLFAVVFVVRDMLHKLAGAAITQRVILIGVVLNLAMAAFMYAMTFIPAPAFRPSVNFDAVFKMSLGIVIGSEIATVASQWVNTVIYQKLWERDYGSWARTFWSNLLSLPVDAVLFVMFAFVFIPPLLGGNAMDMDKAIARIVSGSTLFKLAVILALTPLVSLAPWRQEAKLMK
jgi:uncharacterized integral membrane protein (TIGR00697 family)